jgi:solute carrier family 39 (zinc transporter), member 1/2/3
LAIVLQVLYDEATQAEPEPDPCVYETPKEYTMSLHVGAIFVILVASALGAAIPLVGSHRSKLAVPPFVIVLGKCMGTGVILACGLIHMLLVGLVPLWALGV